jgi:DNA-binding transcriptional LysR family regulator
MRLIRKTGRGRQAADEADPERGQVVLAFLYTLGEQRVPRLLRAFRRQHPHVRFTLLQGPNEELLDHVRSGRADLAFTLTIPCGPRKKGTTCGWPYCWIQFTP